MEQRAIKNAQKKIITLSVVNIMYKSTCEKLTNVMNCAQYFQTGNRLVFIRKHL